MALPPKVVELVEYLNLVTGFHNQRPRFMDTVALSVEPGVDGINTAWSLLGLFDLDTAEGEQLDFTGQWIGVGRIITYPLEIWFTFDRPNLGFDEAKWRVPYEIETGQIVLDDYHYRLLLYARVIANYWDGTIPDAYRAWQQIFYFYGYQILLQDQNPAYNAGSDPPRYHGDMAMTQALMGPSFNKLIYALFTEGYLGLKSAGVRINYLLQSPGYYGIPMFAFDCGPSNVHPPPKFPPIVLAGFDVAAWGVVVYPIAELPPPVSVGDALVDGKLYGRQYGEWQLMLPQAGGTLPITGGMMKGPLTLFDHPTRPKQAATKWYADLVDGGFY